MNIALTETASTDRVDAPAADRRGAPDRRQHFLWSLLYGGFHPRRRAGRRLADHHRPIVDWHSPDLLFSSVGLIVLCLCDAALTLVLLAHGASEANPVMALIVDGDVERFALVKLALTASSLLALVAVARFTVFRVIRVATLVHLAMAGYVVLIGYEAWLVSFLLP